MNSIQNKKIVIFGAGAVGSTIGGWIAPFHSDIYFLDQGPILESLKKNGLTLFCGDEPNKKEHIKVKTISNLSELDRVDYIFLAVKNYSLDKVSQIIKQSCPNDPVIVAFQNGVENQKILPKYFSKVIFGVVGYNVWPEGPCTFGFQKKGPLVLGTMVPNDLQKEKVELAHLMNKGVETKIIDDLPAATYSKLIINLTNSLTTLIGHKQKEISSLSLFQKILTNMTYEGVKVLKTAGIKECSIGGMPSWRLMTAAATLPQFLTRGAFKKNMKKMVMSSMAQDVLQNKSGDSELETINGQLLKMAETYKVNVPYNRAIYNLCHQEFAKKDFAPMDIQVVWDQIKQTI
jgi:2-dehydropantoate 2-reductase